MYSIAYIDSFSKIQFHFFLEIGLSQVDLLLEPTMFIVQKGEKLLWDLILTQDIEG